MFFVRRSADFIHIYFVPIEILVAMAIKMKSFEILLSGTKSLKGTGIRLTEKT